MRKDLYREMYRQESYYWWHVGKRNLVKRLLIKYGYLDRRPIKILDIGCGTGIMISELSSYGEVWGLDASKSALAFCKKRGHKFLIKADLNLKLPFEANKFDIVLCLDVIEHLNDDNFSLSELYRILKPKGILLITVPAYPFLWSYWDELAGHKKRYTSKMLKSMLMRENFATRRISYYYLFALFPAVVFRLVKYLTSSNRKDYTSDFIELPNFLNKLLIFLGRIETEIITKMDLKAGLSLICLAQRNGKA